MRREIVHLGGKPVTLTFNDFEDQVDVDQLLSIDYGNLYGEAVTIPALMNQIGTIKAEAEKAVAEKKLELEVFESTLRQRLRKEATETAQKITETGLTEMVGMDRGYKIQKKNLISANYNLEIVESLWWSIKSKDQKLNNLVRGVSPEELWKELVEGKINNIIIKKHKSITEPNK